MQIDRPVAEAAAAGQRHDRPAPPCQQRPEDAESGPHPPHQGIPRPHYAGIDQCQHQALAVAGNVDAQLTQQPPHRADVGQARNAEQFLRRVGKDRRRHHRQCGVLRPTDRHCAVQWHAAGDDEFRHNFLYCLYLGKPPPTRRF